MNDADAALIAGDVCSELVGEVNVMRELENGTVGRLQFHA